MSIALKLNPNLSIIYYHLGLVYERRQDWQEAINFYQQALDKEGKSDRVLLNLTSLEIVVGNMAKVIELIYPLSKSIQDKQIKSDLLANLGTAYFFTQNYSEAQKNLQLALDINADLIIANYLIAKILERENKHAEALSYWEKCLAKEPRKLLNRSPLVNYAQLEAKLKINH